jgi:hypothetical protein
MRMGREEWLFVRREESQGGRSGRNTGIPVGSCSRE